MDLGKKINRFQFEIRFLLILALFPVIVVITQLYYTYQNISTIYHVENIITSNLKNQQWDTIESIIVENEKRARVQAEGIKNNIERDFRLTYKDNIYQLNNDLDSHDKTRDCYKILKTNIENVFMNVDSLDNRAYIANKEGILIGKEPVEGDNTNKGNIDVRLWETEIESSADPMVASKAIDMILLRDKHVIYWIAEESAKDENLQQLNFETIKNDISQNGISALKSYDILVPAYIPSDSTVLSTTEGIQSVPETQRKLIVIQSFNLYDAFMVHSDDFEKLDYTTDLLGKVMKETVYTDVISLIFAVILTLMTFGATLYGAFLMIKWSADDGDNNGAS